jgi:hypothetical protein
MPYLRYRPPLRVVLLASSVNRCASPNWLSAKLA